MFYRVTRIVRGTVLIMFLLDLVSSQSALACACGCGVFAVGTPSNFPTESGQMVYTEFDYMNQNQNWHNEGGAPSADNADKRIRTYFYTLGYQYQSASGWGITAELPYWDRYFKTTIDDGSMAGFRHNDFGDLRIIGNYSGFVDDRNTGIMLGAKLPSGDHSYPHFDRDTSIGTGSTDLVVGIYHVGALDNAESLRWFGNILVDLPLLTDGGYRPGSELDAVAGVSYNEWSFDEVKIAPVLEVIEAYRQRDSGPLSNRGDSGYDRTLIGPGFQIDAGAFKVFGDVGFPVYQKVNGNQLIAPEIFKLNVSYSF